MEKKILPLSRQSFRQLREDNCIYVDKTRHIYDLARKGGMYFLSRPRRFGKSLLVSTMEELFSGNKDLFMDTWIADKWDWTKKSPVIHISFLDCFLRRTGIESGYKSRNFIRPIIKIKPTPRPKKYYQILFFELIKNYTTNTAKSLF